MDVLPLDVVGWVFTVGCALALLVGTWLTLSVHKFGAPGRNELATRLLDDLMLFTIWLVGLAGGIGVLLGKGWSRPVLELFCWTIMILLAMSAVKRFRAMPPPRLLLGASLAAFVAPVVAFCVATILTLRGEAAVKQLSVAGRILWG